MLANKNRKEQQNIDNLVKILVYFGNFKNLILFLLINVLSLINKENIVNILQHTNR